MISLSDAAGLAGVFISSTCYARVQWQRDYAKKISYSLLNLIASILFGISICNNWNLASFVSNTIWGTISAYGTYRCLKYMWKANHARRIIP